MYSCNNLPHQNCKHNYLNYHHNIHHYNIQGRNYYVSFQGLEESSLEKIEYRITSLQFFLLSTEKKSVLPGHLAGSFLWKIWIMNVMPYVTKLQKSFHIFYRWTAIQTLSLLTWWKWNLNGFMTFTCLTFLELHYRLWDTTISTIKSTFRNIGFILAYSIINFCDITS